MAAAAHQTCPARTPPQKSQGPFTVRPRDHLLSPLGLCPPIKSVSIFLVLADGYPDIKMNVKFVQDTSKFWYKPDISREQGETRTNPSRQVCSQEWNDRSMRLSFFVFLSLWCPLQTPSSVSWLHSISAINLLKDREPGAFIIRDSHSFRGAYGLAMKVACPPPTVPHNKKGLHL